MLSWGRSARRDRERPLHGLRSGNRYTMQRRLGFPWLMFMPELEREYQQTVLPMTRLRVRMVSLLAALGVLVFVAIDRFVGQTLMSDGPALLLSLLGIPVISLAFVASFHVNFSSQLRLLVMMSFTGYGAVLIFSILWSRMSHPGMPYESLLLLTFAGYLLSGVGLYEALTIGFTLFTLYVAGAVGLGVQDPALPYEIFYLVLANVIGCVGLYVLDYQARQSFLASNELRLLSMQDGLTGVLNRRTFRRHLRQVRLQAQREGKVLGLMRLDVDGFKQINDVYGHAYGDHALRAVGQTLIQMARRPLDAVGRVGGDEFEIVWYDIEPATFASFGASIQARLNESLQQVGLQPDAVRVSGGVSLMEPGRMPPLKDWLNQIDVALHEAKRRGRNRLIDAAAPDVAA